MRPALWGATLDERAAAVAPKTDPEKDPPGSPVVGDIPKDLENPDALPAVDAEHLPPAGDSGIDSLESQAPDLRPMPANEARKVVMAALRALDKLSAVFFRLDATPASELEEYAAAITPALAHYGEQPGPKFWLGVAFLGLGGFLAARILEGVRLRRSVGPDSDVETSEKLGADAEGARSGLGREVSDPGA